MRRKTQTKDKIIIAVVLACFSASYFCSWKDDVLRKFVYPITWCASIRTKTASALPWSRR